MPEESFKKIFKPEIAERKTAVKNALIKLHIAVFLAGFTAILGKLIGLNEGLLVWYRLFITVISLGTLMYFNKQLNWIGWKPALQIFSVGVIVALHWIAFYGSIKYSTVSVSLTCLSAMAFFTSFIEPLLLNRRIDFVEVFLGLLAIAGIYLIFSFNPEYKVGIIFGIISALLASIFPILNKEILKKHQPKTVTIYEMTGGLIALSVLVPLYLQLFPAEYLVPTFRDIIWLLVLSWFCTILSFDLQLKALEKLSAFTSNLTYNLEPVYGIILGFVIFHENKYLSGGFYLGFACILLAVILQMLRMRAHSRNES